MRASTAQLQYDAAMPSSAAERRGILVHMEVVLRFSSSFDKVVHEVIVCSRGSSFSSPHGSYFKVGALGGACRFCAVLGARWRPVYRVR